MADTYFQIINDNNVVVIDDTYKNPTFVLKGVVNKDTATPKEVASNGVSWQNVNGGTTGKIAYYSETYKYADFGLTTMPDILGVRCTSAPDAPPFWSAARAYVVSEDSVDGTADSFRVQINVIDEGHTFAFAIWTTEPRKESGMGMALYNAQGEMVFDATYGFLQVVDCRYEKYDVFSSKTKSYEIENSDLAEVDPERLYLIMGNTPLATTGGTIVIKMRRYVPRLRYDKATGKSFVDIAMWGELGGSIVQQYAHTLSYRVAYLQF